MRRLFYLLILFIFTGTGISSKTLTYNQLDTVNLRDQGIPADERSTKVLIVSENTVYGATSGDRCRVFRLNPHTIQLTVLAASDVPSSR